MEKVFSVYEQMETYGVDTVNTVEAVSTLTGVDKFVLNELVTEFGSVQEACLNALYITDVITKRQIQKLSLLGELFQRNTQLKKTDKVRITSPSVISEMYMNEMKYLKVEHFNVVLLDTKNCVIKNINISSGTLNSTVVHPREVFKEAIKHNSNAMILLHNHPSGDTSPSTEDINITNRLVDAGALIGIKVLDHVIIGDNYCSFKERGLI